MADLHPEVEKMIEAGPQEVSGCMDDDAGSQRETVRQETPKEFARRIAALQQKKTWEEQNEIRRFHWRQMLSDVDNVIADRCIAQQDRDYKAAIRRRGKP